MAKAAVKTKADDDPYNIHPRLEKLIGSLLDEWEANPDLFAMKDKLSIVTTLGMYLTRNLKLKDAGDESNAGSAVKRYSSAFRVATPNATGRRASNTRPTLVTDPDTDGYDPDDAA